MGEEGKGVGEAEEGLGGDRKRGGGGRRGIGGRKKKGWEKPVEGREEAAEG